MDPARFGRLKEIWLTASRLPEAERAPYLDGACRGDPELRQEVEALLAEKPASVDLLRTGGLERAVESAAVAPGPPAPLPDTIGPYRIRGVLGEGGMGIVFRAEQTEPIRREVALKLVRRGFDTARIFARFESERQTLALMDHPNIARVLEAGSDDFGNPYFVMELVHGIPLTDYCRAESLSLKERIRLFRTVCHGVQHAHQKGIIHRDLKPSNVMVTSSHGRPVPKIIDFGIAKAIGESPGGSLTQEGQLVGTLEYMSPEQASGRSADVDTRSDVYSLGVLLYEIVTGRPPYEIRTLPLPEAVRVINEAPPAPLRRTFTGNGRVDPDLETILLETLAKEPDRRYASAAALADDLDRWLRSEPILAHPPSAFYQMRKLVSRHRAPFAFAATVVALIFTFGVTQRRERARAETEAARARQVAGFLQNMLASADPAETGGEVSVRDLLDEAAHDLDAALADQPEVQATLHQTIGNAYRSLARFDDAQRHLEAGLAIRSRSLGAEHPLVAESQAALATLFASRDIDESDLAKADSLAQRALAVHRSAYGDRHASVADDLGIIAGIATARARWADAESLHVEVVAIRKELLGNDHLDVADALSDLAKPLHYQGKAEEAERVTREALGIRRRRLGDEHSRVGDSLNDLAFLLHQRGKLAEAESLFLRSSAIARRVHGDDHPYVANRLSNLSSVYMSEDRFDEAEAVMREALAIQSAAFGESSSFVATAHNNLATCLDRKGDYGGAERHYKAALEIWRENLGEKHPNIATGLGNLGIVAMNRGRAEESERLNREALALSREIFGEEHVNTGLRHYTLATLLLREGRFDDASESVQASVAILGGALPPTHILVAAAEWNVGLLALGRQELDDAAKRLAATVSLFHEAGVERHWLLAGTHRDLGRALHDLGRLDEAEAELRSAWAMNRELTGPDHILTADSALCLADLLVSRGRAADALPLLEAALAAFRANYPPDHHRTALATVLRAKCGGRWESDAERASRAIALAHPGNLAGERARAATSHAANSSGGQAAAVSGD